MGRCYIKKLLALSAILLGTISCTPHNNQYAHYEVIDKDGWHQEKELFFSVPKLSPDNRYKVTLAIRFDRSIRYEEVPLGVVIESPTRKIQTEVVKIPTTTDNLRTGGYNFSEKSCILSDSEAFGEEGVYSYSVRHLSTDSVISGVIEVGIIIEPIAK